MIRYQTQDIYVYSAIFRRRTMLLLTTCTKHVILPQEATKYNKPTYAHPIKKYLIINKWLKNER